MRRILAALFVLLWGASAVVAMGLGNGCVGFSCVPGLNVGSGLSYSQGLDGSYGPAYQANFLSMTSTADLTAAGISVSSPSLGGLVTDSSGKLTYKPNNLLTYSNDLSQLSAWSAFGTPSGSVSGSTVTFTGTGNDWRYQQPSSTAATNYLVGATLSAGTKSKIVLISNSNYKQVINLTSTPTVYYFVSNSPVIGLDNRVSQGGDGLAGTVIASNFFSSAVTYETTPRPQDQVITTASAYYGPAFDHDSSGNPLGLRVWESRANNIVQSSAFSNAAWLKSNLTVGASSTGPDGVATSATLLTASAANGTIYQQVQTGGGNATDSIYLKRSAGTGAVNLSLDGGATFANVASQLNSTTFTKVSASQSLTALATPVNAAFATSTTGGTLAAGTYYYRVTATNALGETLASTETSIATTGTTSTVTVNWGAVTGATGYKIYGRATGAELFMASVGAVTTWTDTGAITPSGALPSRNSTADHMLLLQIATSGDAVIGWNGQLEPNASFAGPPIPTGSSAVTAAADDVRSTSISWYNPNAGTIIVKATPPNVAGHTDGSNDWPSAIAFAQATPNTSNFISVDRTSSSTARGRVFSAGTAAIDADLGTWANGTLGKVALAYQSANSAAAFDGAAPSTSSTGSPPSGITQMLIGSNGFGTTGSWDGTIASITYYNSRQPNAKLQSLTQ